MRLEACASGEIEFAQIENLGREDSKNFIDLRWWKGDIETLTDLKDRPDSHWKRREIISYH